MRMVSRRKPSKTEDVEERVQEVMTQVTSEETYVGIEERQVDVDERATVTTMVESTCECRKGIGSRPCSSQFSADHLMSVQASCSELSRSELDMVVMGQLMGGINDETTTNSQGERSSESGLQFSPSGETGV